MKNNNKFRLDVWGFITLAMIALYLLFMIYPMGYLIRQSVWNPETGAFTWENFSKFFSKSYYFDTLFNSFKVSIAATVLSLVIGTPLAYLFSIYKIRGKYLFYELGRLGHFRRIRTEYLNARRPAVFGYPQFFQDTLRL